MNRPASGMEAADQTRKFLDDRLFDSPLDVSEDEAVAAMFCSA